ncbi:HEAT repeat domain-containing protein [Sulfurimonas sp. HSL3-7]|uniref:HEAT repeat domain-containing protein n=1 Tax=Sulfonitrofixus jiaomeiensis TaxID=3131938 RepID=UPI0031F88962
MNGQIKRFTTLLPVSLVLVFLQACSIKIPVDSPKPSETSYQDANSSEMKVEFESDLNEDHEVAAGDRTTVFILEHNHEKIDAGDFIKSGLQNEIAARKIPLKFVSPADDKLTLDHFEIITHRATGFSPLVTVSTLKVEMKVGDETKSFVSLIKRAKTPVWSMNEVFEPCYNEATTLLIKEVVAKINQAYFGHKLSDQSVERLKQSIATKAHGRSTYMDVYELGFSNNKNSIDYLKTLTTDPDEYIRLAAISGIGTLGEKTQFSFLVSINKNATLWQDRAMALKSIGDLGTKEAYDYLAQRQAFWTGKTSNEAIWNLKIINLYSH